MKCQYFLEVYLIAFNSHTHPYSLLQFISDSKVVVPRFLARVFGDASSTRSCYRFLKPNFGTHGLHSQYIVVVVRSQMGTCCLPVCSLVVGSGYNHSRCQRKQAVSPKRLLLYYYYYAAQRKHYNYQFGFTSSPFIDPLAIALLGVLLVQL